MQGDLPDDLVAEIDRLKGDAGLRGRASIIEEALRFYIKAKQGTQRRNTRPLKQSTVFLGRQTHRRDGANKLSPYLR